MKNLHPARKRLLLGVLLLAAAFFYAFAPTCGIIGQLIARASGYLIGQTGSMLLALTALVVGVLLVLPHGAVGSFVRWIWHGREARVGRVVREMDAHVAKRKAERAEERAALSGDPAIAEAVLTPKARMQLDAVRAALTDLGYTKKEMEPIVTKMDPSRDFAVLVRAALKELRVN